MSRVDLLPCPFCGGRPSRSASSQMGDWGKHEVSCGDCGASTSHAECMWGGRRLRATGEGTAAEKWNTRTKGESDE